MALPAMGVELEMSKFVRNLHEMVSDDANSPAVGFSPDGLSLELRDTEHLSQVVLPKYFKHGNISSLTRQLNNYGFKTNPPRTNAQVSQSFTHPFFCRGKAELYGHVKRRTAPLASSSSSSSAAAAAVVTGAGSRMEEDKKLRMDQQQQQQPGMLLINSSMLQAQTMMHQQQHQKPSYQQLLELNSRLQQQNSLLEDRVRQLEDAMRTRSLPSPSIGVQPQFLMPPSTSSSHQQLQQQQYNRTSVGRMSGEQPRLFPNMTSGGMQQQPRQPQVLGFGGIRSSGEQARYMFGEDASGGLDDDDVVTLKNMFLRTSMDEDQAL